MKMTRRNLNTLADRLEDQLAQFQVEATRFQMTGKPIPQAIQNEIERLKTRLSETRVASFKP